MDIDHVSGHGRSRQAKTGQEDKTGNKRPKTLFKGIAKQHYN
jgi:hypothetical protein